MNRMETLVPEEREVILAWNDADRRWDQWDQSGVSESPGK
jgi:hypothetical protein